MSSVPDGCDQNRVIGAGVGLGAGEWQERVLFLVFVWLAGAGAGAGGSGAVSFVCWKGGFCMAQACVCTGEVLLGL